ncbi:MAG: hypothetical protein ACXVKL_06655 [Candidatus Angelobacter sp.]
MSHWNDERFERVLEEVVKRAVLDPDFRRLALADSGQAIQKFDPTPLPQDLNLAFLEGDSVGFEICGSNRTVTLPAPLWASGELTDMELEEVAGADCLLTCACSDCFCTNCCVTDIQILSS